MATSGRSQSRSLRSQICSKCAPCPATRAQLNYGSAKCMFDHDGTHRRHFWPLFLNNGCDFNLPPPTADDTSTPNVNAYSPVIAASTSADFAPPSPTPPDTNMIRPSWPAASHQIQPPPQLPSIPQPAMIMEERLNVFQVCLVSALLYVLSIHFGWLLQMKYSLHTTTSAPHNPRQYQRRDCMCFRLIGECIIVCFVHFTAKKLLIFYFHLSRLCQLHNHRQVISHFSLACYTTTNWNRKRHGGREQTQPKKSKFMGGGPKYNNQLGKLQKNNNQPKRNR